uniref:Serpentine receptor class gamma n=1 Tax=Caenorhabditis tropicalis TaxID=1561998 RepID=A0A1I7UW66_9PELO
MTAWCANQKPNHFLKVLFMFSVYFNYTAMLFPFLLSMLRLIPLYKPFNHDKLCARIVRISTPLIFIYPFLFCFPLVVALGECRQLQGSYQFGAIYIYYDRSLFNLKQAITLFLNVIFWFLVSTVTNGILYAKLRKLRKTTSVKLQRAELSLTFLTFSMLSAYITNLAFVVFFIFWPATSAYLVALRPYGNDCDFVLVPWLFYFTHPIFKQNRQSRASPATF